MSSQTDIHTSRFKIRVLVANLPSVVSEMLRTMVSEQPGIDLAGEVTGDVELLAAVDETIDIVLLGAPQLFPTPGICSHLFGEFPNLKIIVLPANEKSADVLWLSLHKHRFSNVNSHQLVRIIRLLCNFDVGAI